MTFRGILSSIVIVGIVALSNVALAQTPGQSTAPATPAEPGLVWRAPRSCPPASEILTQVARLLRREPPLSPTPEGFHAEVTVTENSDVEFEASVDINHADEMRVIRGETCEAIAEAVTIMITIAIDPNADVVLESFHDANRDHEPATEVTPPMRELIPVRDPFELRLDAGGGITSGALPGVAPGLSIATSLRASLFVVHAGFSYLFPQKEDTFGIGTFSMMRGELAGGFAFAPGHGRLWMELLIQLELAGVHGESMGIDQSTSGSGIWFGAGLSTRLRYQVASAFGLYFAFSGISAFDRPKFDVTGVGTIFRSSGIEGRADVGLSVRFDI